MPPNRGPAPVKLFRKDDAEVLTLGPITCYVFEDGSHTDNRVGAVLLMIPPGVKGPPMHWHRFHDELFFVTKGTVAVVLSVRNMWWGLLCAVADIKCVT